MPLKLDNPASRFHRIVERAASSSDTMRITKVWADALEASDIPTILVKLGLFYALPRQIEQQLQRREDYDPHEMAWWPPFANIICGAGFGRPFSDIKGAFTPDLIEAVRSRARTLSRYYPEPTLDDSELQYLSSLIAEVRAAVTSDDGMDSEAVEYILMRLARMQDILGDINIVGAVGVREALETVRQDVASKAEEVKNSTSGNTQDAFDKWNRRVQAVLLTLGMGGVSMGQLAAGVEAVKPSQPPAIEDTLEKRRPQLEPERDSDSSEDDVTDVEFKPA